MIVIVSRWLRQRYRGVQAATARQSAIQAGFFVIMVIYPKVSSEIFRMLRTRRLGLHAAVLEADYSVHTDTLRYARYQLAAAVLVPLVPVGVPVVLLVLLLFSYRHRPTALEDDIPGHVPLRPLVDSGPANATMTRYKLLYGTFGFCMGDFRPGCYWYEPVDPRQYCSSDNIIKSG